MPESKSPDEPFDDIIEMFRTIAENGESRPSTPGATPPAATTETSSPEEASIAERPALTEGVVPISTIEKLLMPTPRSSPAPRPYVGVARVENHDALAAVLGGGRPAAVEPTVTLPDDVVLTHVLASPSVSVPPFGPTAPAPTRRPSTPSRRGRGRLYGGVAVAAALVTATGIYGWQQSKDSGTTDVATDTESRSATIGAPLTFGATPLTTAPTPVVSSAAPSASSKASATAVATAATSGKAVVPPTITPPKVVPPVVKASTTANAAAAAAAAAAEAEAAAKEAKRNTAAIVAYSKKVVPLANEFGAALSEAPNISPDDSSSSATTAKFYSALTQASHDYDLLRNVSVPAGPLATAHSRLLAAMRSARDNLINGQNVALNAENCTEDPCHYGAQRGWSAYTSTLPSTWSYEDAARAWVTAVAKAAKS